MLHLDYIAQLTLDIQYIKGTNNIAAGALSCMEVDMLHTTPSVIDFTAMVEAQSTDPPEDRGAQSLTVL